MSGVVVDIIVFGIPQQQGSKNPWGGDANKNLMPWRTAVMNQGKELMADHDSLLEGPIQVDVTFAFPRPQAHHSTTGGLKASAPHRHFKKPDADKLQRALGDALTGVVIKDDALISDWIVRKRYAARPYTRAIISTLREATDDAGGTHDVEAGEDPRSADSGGSA